jgi:predicted DNA-binding protein YlxM (UPF0122 family)
VGEIQDLNQDHRDAEIWREWVSGTNQREIAELRGISQAAVSQACARFAATIQTQDKLLFLLRALERMDKIQRVFQPLVDQKDKGAARVVIQAQALEGRYLGLDSPAKLELYQAQDQIRHESVDVRAELAALLHKIREEQHGDA